MGVLTLFEVMDSLEKDYHHILHEDDIKKLGKDFESGIDRAIDIVSYEFAEDLDLDGNPQLLHMTAVSSAGKNDDERLVGMLHDLVEDKDWTFEDLLEDGFPEHIVDTLRLLTHDKQTPYMDYVKNICESGNQVALAVKINDLNHNLKRGRAGGHWHHVEKHEKALAYIEEFIQQKKENE
jgi:(p)ppGpp synthase/HD superfamily hydrolase